MTKTEDWLTLVEPWKVEEKETLVETKIFSLRERRCTSPTSPEKSGTFVYLDSPDWVNVIALTAAGQVVTIEQFRHGTAASTLEIPGGMVDAGESPLDAGQRELREETGYAGERAWVIGAVSPNPAFLNNRCHTVLVRDVTPKYERDLDGNEEIAVRLVDLAAIADLCRRGLIHHALVVCAFHHLALRAELPGL